MSRDDLNKLKSDVRRLALVDLAGIEARHGKETTSVYAEAHLEALAVYLTGSVGAHAAFNIFQRHADNVAGDVIQALARSQ